MTRRLRPLPPAIAAVCRDYYGTYRGNDRWSPPNRCGSCPLHAPCVARGSAPARTFAELDASREAFIIEAQRILGGQRP